jgi:hypothetical protein
MPPAEALPLQIEALASRQALPLREEGWDEQMEALLEQLESRMSESHRSAVGGRRERPGETTIRSEFQTVASRFYGASIDERIAAAEEIANLGGLLRLEEVLAYARSRRPVSESARRSHSPPTYRLPSESATIPSCSRRYARS